MLHKLSTQLLQMAWSRVGSRPSEATELTARRIYYCMFIVYKHEQLQVRCLVEFLYASIGILRYLLISIRDLMGRINVWPGVS